MSAPKHTPEPWMWDEDNCIRSNCRGRTDIFDINTSECLISDPPLDESYANAVRTIECVNALAGIDDPAAYRAKVDAFRDAVNSAITTLVRTVGRDAHRAENELRTALAALEEK